MRNVQKNPCFAKSIPYRDLSHLVAKMEIRKNQIAFTLKYLFKFLFNSYLTV